MKKTKPKGEKLKELRLSKGWTQSELGARLSPALSKQQIYKLEAGRHRITANLAVKLGKALGVAPETIADEAVLVAPERAPKKEPPALNYALLVEVLKHGLSEAIPDDLIRHAYAVGLARAYEECRSLGVPAVNSQEIVDVLAALMPPLRSKALRRPSA